jgi:cobalt-zinc-cadmium efflux system membrane fusion protein
MHASTDKLFRLPISALTSQEGKDYVFVRVPQGFAARPVAVAGRAEHEAVIHGGLNDGDEVVVQGVAALKASWIGIGGNE